MRRALLPLLLLAALLCPTAARAVDNPLEAIPDSAGLLMRFQSPRPTIVKWIEFLKTVDPKLAQQADQMKSQIGVLISNPQGAGVDMKRDWYVAAFPTAEGQTGVLFAIPAEKHDEMEQAIGGGFQFIRYENWLLYTQDQSAADLVRSRVAGAGASLAKRIDAASKTLMDDSDASLYVNVKHFTSEVYKVELEATSTELQAAIEQTAEFAPPVEGIDVKPLFEYYARLGRAMLQTVKEIEGLTVGVVQKSRGVELEALVSVPPGSNAAELLQKFPASDMSLFDQLPADQLIYVGLGDADGLMQWGTQLWKMMLPQNDEKQQDLERLLKAYTEIELGGYAMSLTLGNPAEGILRLIALTEADSTQKMRDLTRSSTELMAQMGASSLVRQEVEYRADAETYGEHSADVMTVRQYAGGGDEGAAKDLFELSPVVQTIYGPDGMATRLVYLPKLVVQTQGGGKALMEQALAAATKSEIKSPGPRRDPAIQAARARLTEKSSFVMLIDVTALVVRAGKMLAAMPGMPLPIDVGAIEKVATKRSYAGLAVAGGSQGLRVKVSLPKEQLQGIAKFGELMPRGQQGGAYDRPQ